MISECGWRVSQDLRIGSLWELVRNDRLEVIDSLFVIIQRRVEVRREVDGEGVS